MGLSGRLILKLGYQPKGDASTESTRGLPDGTTLPRPTRGTTT